MDFPQFLRLFYQSFSPKADCETAKNLYLERIESGNGRGDFAMLRSPGLKIFSGDVPVILTSCPIQGVQVGVAFSLFLTPSGGTPPYTWLITSGSLPNGLTLNPATGEISGTATEAGTFPFTVQITDANHIVGSKSCFVISTIGPPASPPEIISECPITQGDIGVGYTFTFETENGVAPFTWTIIAGALPDGLELDPDTGEITGTPLEDGTFNFTVQVTDANDDVVSKACAVIITPPVVYSTCSDIIPLVEYADDFNRSDNPDLGAPWDQYTRNVTMAYQIVGNKLQAYRQSVGVRTGGAAFAAFPSGQTHQISKMIFRGAVQLGAPSSPSDNINGGGPCVRMNQLGGGGLFSTVRCYQLYYLEQRSSTPPYNINFANLNLDLHDGAGGVTNLDSISPTPLSDGDELKLVAMNFTSGATNFVCLRAYINDVLQITRTINLATANGITTGQVGIGTSLFGGDDSFVMEWDDWKGYTAV